MKGTIQIKSTHLALAHIVSFSIQSADGGYDLAVSTLSEQFWFHFDQYSETQDALDRLVRALNRSADGPRALELEQRCNEEL
ncbi:hypothetical protein DQK91_18915 [Oceanidesulfovibrio marinus]|uniref:Uncharacterized protein n=1 Tax=Oceanidesulfovibrio marinus TaxID=370038 RepID=A0A6P1ZB80_9BACT|nr:hypothetical protein DQK91_18915 [Oceanidesulfovibrio marinus]